jgi:ABC-type multidrug transport system fused ATPase/permease subunit
VDFAYPSRKLRVLRNFNMQIEGSKKIALVGYSGCGKSTIANLLLRFYDVLGGSIKIDGIDIKEYNVEALRK